MNQDMDPLNLTEGQQAEKYEMSRKRQNKLDKAEISRVKSCERTAAYQKERREWANNYQKIRYNTNNEYRKKKGLQAAYVRYLNGVNVANHIVDLLKENGYGDMPYRKKVY